MLRPLGVSQAEVDKAIDDGVASLKDGGVKKLTGGAVTGALAALNLLAAILLHARADVFPSSRTGGEPIFGSPASSGPAARAAADELGERVWRVLSGYVHGVACVAAGPDRLRS